MKLKLRTGILAALGIMLIFSVPLVAQDQEEDYTFRSTRWGMSKSEVIEQEGEPDHQEDSNSGGYESAILYDGISVGRLDTYLIYYFTEDKLVRGVYNFQEDHTSENTYIDDFKKIKGILTNKYGRPEYDDEIWHKDLYKDDPDYYGFAVSIGDLEYRVRWETEETEIWLTLDGDNYEIDHHLYYDSKELKELVEEEKEEQTQSQF